MFQKVQQREEGQGLVEYALILVLVAIVVIAILLQLGPAVSEVFCKVTNVLQGGACDTGGLTIISGPTATDIGGVYNVSVTLQVAEAGSVTLTAGGVSESTSCAADTSCSITVTTSSGSGSYQITAGSLSKSGTY